MPGLLRIVITKAMITIFGAIKISIYNPDNCMIPDNSIPVPTPAQLKYQLHEIVAFITFNMATFSEDGDPGCNNDNWNYKAAYATGPT